MSVPTEPGWYWARTKGPDAPWEVLRVTNWGGDIGPLGLERSGVHLTMPLEEWPDKFEWGPRIPSPAGLRYLSECADTAEDEHGLDADGKALLLELNVSTWNEWAGTVW